MLTDETDPVAALLSAGVTEVVVKHGAGGATSHRATGTIHRPARTVPVVDTVGAGDAFVAGLLSAWLDGADAPARLDRAVTTGAFAVATRGDWEVCPTGPSWRCSITAPAVPSADDPFGGASWS
ncbi:PfkB family carbohydrate kinase [Micromonospora sp. M12]